ncbi:hypothetical protein Tco_0676786 [Tanacetum coccineum]
MKGHLTSDKSVKHIGKSKEVGTLRYLSLVVPLKKVGDEAVHKELGDRMEMAATTASSLEAEQDSGSGPRVNTLGSGEDSMKLMELIAHYTKLSALSEGGEVFHEIIDFLTASHIHHAFIENPTIYASPIQQFWQTAALCIIEDRVQGITATIDRKLKVLVTKASIRRHLKLEDSEGLKTLPTTEMFEQLALIGYVTTSDSLTFQKGYFSPQWKFFIHTILHCLSHKKTGWEQFSSNIATAIIFLTTNRTFNFSNFVFEAIVKNIDKEPAPMPHESPLQSVHSLGRDEGSLTLNELTVMCTTLSKKVSSKQGRKISEIDTDPSISLVQDEGRSWFQEDVEIQEKISDDTEVLLEEEEPTKIVEDQGSGKKGEKEVSTIGAKHSTVIPKDNTATTNLVYIRRSAEKRIDKGKAIIREDESVQKKTKKQLDQERLSHETAIRLQEQIDEEERKRIARDAEIAKQLQEEYDRARQE